MMNINDVIPPERWDIMRHDEAVLLSMVFAADRARNTSGSEYQFVEGVIFASLDVNDFMPGDNLYIYRTMKQMYEEGLDINVATLPHHLAAGGKMDKGAISTATYLDNGEGAVTCAYWRTVIGAVKDNSRFRRAAEAMAIALQPIGCGTDEADDELGRVIDRLVEIKDEPSLMEQAKPKTSTDIVTQAYEAIAARANMTEEEIKARNIMWPWSGINEHTFGLAPSSFWVISADTSVGKSAAACNLARRTVEVEHKHVLYLTLEMDALECVNRMYADETDVSIGRINYMALDADELRKMLDASNHLAKGNYLHIVNCGSFTEIVNHIRSAVARHECDLVIVDHLQIVAADDINKKVREMTKSAI